MTNPAQPSLSIVTQQGGGVRGHDPAQQEKITKFFEGLLKYQPFAQMVVQSGMDLTGGVTGISAQLGIGNRLILKVSANGTTTPFVIAQATAQGISSVPGIDAKIVEATKFLLNPSAPNATPPDFDPPAPAAPPAGGSQPQPPGGPQPAQPAQPPAPAAPVVPPTAPVSTPAPAATPPQPSLPIPAPVDDPEIQRFLALQADQKDTLTRIWTSLEKNRESLFAKHDADQEALAPAQRAITRIHKTLLKTLRQEFNDLKKTHEQQFQDLFEERQELQKTLNISHLTEQRNLLQTQPRTNLAPLLARQFRKLQQQQQDEIDLYEGLQEQQQRQVADLFLQQQPRRAPLSLALRNLLEEQEREITNRCIQHQTSVIAQFRRQHSQRMFIHQELQQVEALPVIQSILTAIGPSAIPVPPATLPAGSIIGQAQEQFDAAEKALEKAAASRNAITTLNARATATAGINRANAELVNARRALMEVRTQASAVERALDAAQTPAQTLYQLAIANQAGNTALAQFRIVHSQSTIVKDSAAEAERIAETDAANIRSRRNWRWAAGAGQALLLGAAAVKALHDMDVINGPQLLMRAWSAIPKLF